MIRNIIGGWVVYTTLYIASSDFLLDSMKQGKPTEGSGQNMTILQALCLQSKSTRLNSEAQNVLQSFKT